MVKIKFKMEDLSKIVTKARKRKNNKFLRNKMKIKNRQVTKMSIRRAVMPVRRISRIGLKSKFRKSKTKIQMNINLKCQLWYNISYI